MKTKHPIAFGHEWATPTPLETGGEFGPILRGHSFELWPHRGNLESLWKTFI